MVRSATGELRGVWRELRQIGRRGRQVWQLVPGRHRWALGGALLIVSLASAGNTAVAPLLGRMVDSVAADRSLGLAPSAILKRASVYLGLLGLAYLVRESMNVLRRYLVENTCTRINKDMNVRLVAHLMKVDLSILAQDQVGALYGRITRSSDGFVRFLRISFLDFVPALFTGAFAVAYAVLKQPWVALVMVGVVPVSLSLTIWQLITQKGIRLDLMRTREVMDGTVVELLSGIDYVRAANTDRQEVRRVRERLSGSGPGKSATILKCRFSVAARRLTRGSSISSSSPSLSTCSLTVGCKVSAISSPSLFSTSVSCAP